jgi:hypothetical protein
LIEAIKILSNYFQYIGILNVKIWWLIYITHLVPRRKVAHSCHSSIGLTESMKLVDIYSQFSSTHFNKSLIITS